MVVDGEVGVVFLFDGGAPLAVDGVEFEQVGSCGGTAVGFVDVSEVEFGEVPGCAED